MPLKGVLLCGGRATRLEELTRENGGTNKHLLRIGEKPMVYYPLEMLQNTNIKEICLITGKEHAGKFIDLLGAGKVFKRKNKLSDPDQILFDLDMTYRVQEEAGGIAQAIALTENFANKQPIIVALGDNIIQGNIHLHTQNFLKEPDKAKILVKAVSNPRDYGVIALDHDNPQVITDILEKPTDPPSNLAVIGIYFYPSDVYEVIKQQKPSGRGEMEITDVNKWYLQNNRLTWEILTGWWEDAGRDAFDLDEIGILIKKTGANNQNI